MDLIERIFRRKGSLYIACNDRNAFFSHLMQSEIIIYGLVRTFLLDNIYIRFGSKLYRQSVDIPMGTNCAPLVADLFLFCCERVHVVPFRG